jgi:Zn-finger domain-containing protein
MEKMDLINTVNQLLSENSKLRSDKTAIEEELKKQRRTSVLERVRSVITSRDVAMCASNKVICAIPCSKTIPLEI